LPAARCKGCAPCARPAMPAAPLPRAAGSGDWEGPSSKVQEMKMGYEPKPHRVHIRLQEDGWWICDEEGPINGPFATQDDAIRALEWT